MSDKACTMTENMEKAGSGSPVTGAKPKKGDRYRCNECSLEIQVSNDCDCKGDCTSFNCCGQPMQRL
jgi:hypothetical protein